MRTSIKILCFAFLIVSCEDFLERPPIELIDEAEFFQTPADLQTAVNKFYNDLPLRRWAGVGNGFSGLPDNNSDMVLGESVSNRLLGVYETPTAANDQEWARWDEIREVNYYLERVGRAEGNEADINHFIGEGYFFRAYYYFDLLKRYGDLPIIDQEISNLDEDFLFAPRDPRNEVVDFMLSDLDTAIGLMKSFTEAPISRLSVEAVQFFKARVALYEGTWERYHNGTVFGVEGSDGSTYLQIAADAARAVMDSDLFSLHGDYGSLFNQSGITGNSEILLAREYDFNLGNSTGNDLQIGWPNRSGYTRFAIRSYLCTDGDPISVSPLYVGDQDLATIESNRDPRLAATIMVPGDIQRVDPDGTTTAYEAPIITGNNAAITGYESQKYRDVNIDGDTGLFTRNTSRIIMRYAEALLIYAEAKAELGTLSQADLDISVNLLRSRVGMPGITLGAITVDPDWPNYGYTLSDILYEIRRERSVELMAEGLRLDDLMRWRAHELFNGRTPKGAFYFDGIVDSTSELSEVFLDADDYLDPFQNDGPYNFDPDRAYLIGIPINEIDLNPNLEQNPGW
ncbi:MAG: RagB/SusD family nutrient uptake outer membrane protein [Bacteroidota bacterium]